MVNIVTGAYMNALSDMTGLTIMYSVPSLAIDMIGALLDFFFIQIAQYSDEAIFIKTELKVKNINFAGFFLLFFDLESLRKLFSTLGYKEA
jgi:chemotaxis protein CheC